MYILYRYASVSLGIFQKNKKRKRKYWLNRAIAIIIEIGANNTATYTVRIFCEIIVWKHS